MKTIGYIASPRKDGNTAWTVNQILQGARDNGHETQVWYSSDLNINPCKGCLGCVNGDSCILCDDMQELYEAIKEADTIVLGSPIYMGQMSAQAKIFTDRLFAQITPRFSPTHKEENEGKKLILAFTQGNPNPEFFQTYYDYTRNMFQLLEFIVEDVVIISGTRTESVSEREGLDLTLQKIVC